MCEQSKGGLYEIVLHPLTSSSWPHSGPHPCPQQQVLCRLWTALHWSSSASGPGFPSVAYFLSLLCHHSTEQQCWEPAMQAHLAKTYGEVNGSRSNPYSWSQETVNASLCHFLDRSFGEEFHEILRRCCSSHASPIIAVTVSLAHS